MATYTIENAKSGRSSCKRCKEKIGKDVLRIGEHVENADFTSTKWYLVPCFNLTRKLKKEGVTADSFVEDHLTDETNESVLSDESVVATIVEQIAAKPKPATKKAVETNGTTTTDPLATLKRNSEILLREEDTEGDGHATKKSKTSVSSLSSTDRQNASAYLEYSTFKADDLKDLLRWNRQHVDGTRAKLLARVIDGHIYGRIGRCASCTKGRFKLSDDGTSVTCSGYYDEDAASRVSCYNVLPVEKSPRLRPWYQSEPSEEEAEEMDTIHDQQIEGGADAGDSGGLASDALFTTAVNMDWDLSNPMGMKKAAMGMLDICASGESSVDLPDSDSKARMDIGKIIIANKDQSATYVLGLVIAKYGLKEAKQKAAKAKSEARGSSCTVPANLSIMEALLELGDLYTKESNYNAGNSYKKVAAAIKGFDFEITKTNAKGLGKGKTKVAGIGKGSADKMYEFFDTGKIAKLEEKRAAAS